MKDEVCAIGYRRLPPRDARWAPWPIARTALALAFRKRSVKMAAALTVFVVFMHAIVVVGQVLVAEATSNDSGEVPISLGAAVVSQVIGKVHGTLSTFIGVQLHATALLLAVAAAGLIAEDRRTRAFELYFSRPLRPIDYAIGKALVPLLLSFATLVLPLLGLFGLALGIAPHVIADELWPLLLPGLLGAIACAAVLSATLLGASAVGERGRTVGVAFVLGLGALGGFANGMAESGVRWAGYLGPLRDVQTVMDALLQAGSPGIMAMLDLRESTNDSAWISAAVLAGISALGVLAVVLRLRKEVRG
ncbi:MAG: ABC transporter permease [Nannocystaceae bacterium]|nr:ABC transporter permease [Nannocystaceae bacterium]